MPDHPSSVFRLDKQDRLLKRNDPLGVLTDPNGKPLHVDPDRPAFDQVNLHPAQDTFRLLCDHARQVQVPLAFEGPDRLTGRRLAVEIHPHGDELEIRLHELDADIGDETQVVNDEDEKMFVVCSSCRRALVPTQLGELPLPIEEALGMIVNAAGGLPRLSHGTCAERMQRTLSSIP